MDPVTITALSSLLVKGIQGIRQYSQTVWSQQGWHGLSSSEKEQTIKLALQIAFENARTQKIPAKTIFWEIMLPNIHRPAEKNINTFFELNPWILNNAEYVPAFEREYQFTFDQIPPEQSILELVTTNKPIFFGGLAIALLIIVYLILK